MIRQMSQLLLTQIIVSQKHSQFGLNYTKVAQNVVLMSLLRTENLTSFQLQRVFALITLRATNSRMLPKIDGMLRDSSIDSPKSKCGKVLKKLQDLR